MSGSSLAPLLVLALVLASMVWVAWDAMRKRSQGADVVATVGPLTLDRPERWLIACVLLWIVAFPLYLVARRTN